jgi:helicase MOV-10
VQLVRRDAEVRILACAPSNAAADYLVERLAAASLDLDKLHRLIAPLPHEEGASEDAKTFSQYQRHQKLPAFRVVVSTCSEAGALQDLDIPVGHFSHIVIDEATQADEPLVMIPIMTFSDSNTNIILAGDPNQLGPNIKSPTAARSGLRRSYLKRLMLLNDVYGLDTQVGKT